MGKSRILILGAGERVKQDLLPVLASLEYQESNVLLIRKSGNQLLDFPQFECTKMDEIKLRRFNPQLIISCLPTDSTIPVIEEVLKFTSPRHLFVDTPVTRIYDDLVKIRVAEGIYILEDNHLVFFSNQLIRSKIKPRIVFVRNAFYDYHGVALLSVTFGKLSKLFIKIRFRNFIFLLFMVGRTLVIWIGPRNYSRGRLYFFKSILNVRFFQEYKLNTEFISEWARNYIRENLDPITTESILNSNPIRYMPFWKRMALGEYLEKFLSNGENHFLTLDQAISNERYFKKYR